ncbi:sugar ABC transporter substrate-binding protein [Nocardioidaceae bacterium SCSIO 66511]|nr:sugar ABC transporter substrate-binding protein [Nocardioidaceae bacterium SCSIO 66511]
MPQPSESGRRHSWRRQVRRCSAIAAVGTLVLTAAACGGDDSSAGGKGDSKGTITFANWASAETTTRPGINALIKEFEKQNPGITVKSEALSFTDIGHQLVLRTQSGNPPDVAQIAGNDTASLAATESLVALDDFADDSLIAKLNPADVDAGTYNDKLVAWPWTDSPQGFWYNKSLMQKAGLDPNRPPTTTDDLMDAMTTIKKKFPDVIGLGIDTTNRSFGLDSNWSWMRTFGAEPIADGKANADTPEMQEYLSFMREMADNDLIQPNVKVGDFRPMAAEDQVAFMWDQNLMQGVVQDTNGMSDEEFYDTWGVTTLPTASSGDSYAVGAGHQLVVFNDSPDQEAAWKFVEFLSMNDKSIQDYTIPVAASFPPVEKPTGEIAKQLDTPVNNEFFEKINPTLTTPPYGQEYTQGFGPIMVGVQKAITSDASIDDIASSMQSDLESALG